MGYIVVDKKKQSRSNKIRKLAGDLQTNVNNNSKTWKIKSKTTTKRKIKQLVRNQYKIIQDLLKIIKEYEIFVKRNYLR